MTFIKRKSILQLGRLCCAALVLFVAENTLAQTTSSAVQRVESGNKVFLEINATQLQSELNQLFSASSAASSQNWGDVLSNGSNPGMDINFSSYDITGLGGLTSTGTLAADSLTLNKDADITGRLSVTDVVNFNDSLTVTGYVEFSDSLEVVKAVSVEETLHVTGVTSLGDSLHVVGNVDLDGLFNVDGAATFGSTLTVAGETTLNDSLHVNSGARIVGTLYADSAVVEDVINGQVSSLSNHSTDGLGEGSTNLYFTEQRAIEALSDTLAYLLQLIADLQNGASDAPGTAPFTCGTSTVTFDGHDYSTVQIGDQCWFAENLRSTQYADGSPIPEVTGGFDWEATNDGARTAYFNDASNVTTYGYLYNWYAVDSAAGLCPTDWHVPTDEEWTALTTELGGEGVAGNKMKSSSTDSPSWEGNNSSGFSGLPGGARNHDGDFEGADFAGVWWSSSPFSGNAWSRMLFSNFGGVDRSSTYRRAGFSVRCLRDEMASSASAPSVTSSAASDLAETTATLNGSVDADGGDAVTATGFVWGTDALLSGASNASGSATSGSFTASLADLTGGTTYYFSAYATNGEGTAYGDTLSFTTTPGTAPFICGTSTVTFDGHDYSTVQIGDQCWFAENLRTTQYTDGTTIPEEQDDANWIALSSGARAAYDNNSSNVDAFGYLYNGYSVLDERGLCPSGWHISTQAEWTSLIAYVGGEGIAALKLKSSSSDSPSWDGANDYGFSAVPSGYRGSNGTFNDGTYDGEGGYAEADFYSVDLDAVGGPQLYYEFMASDAGNAWAEGMIRDEQDNLVLGFSVRCVRDE